MNPIYQQIANLPPEKRAVLEMMLQEQGVDLSQMPILPVSGSRDSLPLSFAQQRLWFLDQMEPGSPLYNICSPVRIKGRLDADALKKSFEHIVQKHETLRTTFFKENAEARQCVHPSADLDFELIPVKQDDEVMQYIAAEASHAFQLQEKAPIRVRLFKISDDEHVAVLTLHHIVSDNWSTGVLIKEFMEIYPLLAQGKIPSSAPLRIQYADFASWQRKWLSGKTLQNQLDYWAEKLAGLPPALDLPTDFPRPAYQSHNGDFLTFTLSPEQTAALKTLAEQKNVTLFMTLMAAFEILLYKYSRQEDFAIGTPIANRNRAEIEPLIGFFINTLVIRSDISPKSTIDDLLLKVKETMIGAYAHQDLPFEMLVEKLDPERDMSQSPLFQTMLVFNNAPVETLKLPGLELELIEFENKTTKFDLIFNFVENKDRLQGKVEFNTDLFRPETIRAMFGHFLRIVDEMTQSPRQSISDLSLLSEKEGKKVLSMIHGQERKISAPDLLIPMLLEQCAARGDKKAIRTGTQEMSYKELGGHIAAVQSLLTKNGVSPGQVVAVAARRTPLSIAAMLGVFAHGAVYLPLDPSYPQDRLQFMLKDSAACLLLSDMNETDETFSFAHLPVVKIDKSFTDTSENLPFCDEQAPAYIIYTSGSTGKPKGVLVSQRAIADHSVDMMRYFELSSSDVTLQFAAMNFDAALEQILSPLLAGATVVLRDDDIWPVEQFASKINSFGLTVVNPTTAYWDQWCAHLADAGRDTSCPTLRLVISGGDAMKPTTLERWQRSPLKNVRLINAYGPTETVITSTCYDVAGSIQNKLSALPIGKPNANRVAYILDDAQNPVPFGLPGELCISGANLAMGYHNRPQQEIQSFMDDPFRPGQRMYRTGDKARMLPDGVIEFLGRVDAQVKIRGFRIEPGEVENVLARYPGLENALVAVKTDALGEKQLVGYFRPKAGNSPVISDIRAFMQKELPPYMVPAAFIHLDEIPLLPGGKVNRRALPVPDDLRSQLSAEYVAPRTETEEKLAAIVAGVLRIDKVGVFDNFFELGGHSMLGMQVMSQIQNEFGVEIPMRVLFESPTVDGIATAIMETMTESLDDDELADMLDNMDELSDDALNAFLNED